MYHLIEQVELSRGDPLTRTDADGLASISRIISTNCVESKYLFPRIDQLSLFPRLSENALSPHNSTSPSVSNIHRSILHLEYTTETTQKKMKWKVPCKVPHLTPRVRQKSKLALRVTCTSVLLARNYFELVQSSANSRTSPEHFRPRLPAVGQVTDEICLPDKKIYSPRNIGHGFCRALLTLFHSGLSVSHRHQILWPVA